MIDLLRQGGESQLQPCSLDFFNCHKYTFSFEKYVTALNRIFKTLESYNESMYDTNKVSTLLEKCANNHAEFKSAVLMCQNLHNTFDTAVTYLKADVGRIFSDLKATEGRKCNIANLGSKGKGKGKGKDKTVNGIDISEINRWYPEE